MDVQTHSAVFTLRGQIISSLQEAVTTLDDDEAREAAEDLLLAFNMTAKDA